MEATTSTNANQHSIPETGTESSSSVTVELTPLFSSDDAIKQAYGNFTQPSTFLKLWCTLAKRLLQSAKYTKRSGKIQDASRRVVVDHDTFSYLQPFIDAGMITVTEADGVSELSQRDFDVFWGNYPQRLTNGHYVKVGKTAASQVFFNEILSRTDFHSLLIAVQNYSKVTSPNYIKDASRFLKVWRDYLEIGTRTKTTKAVLDQSGFNDLYSRTAGAK